MPTPVEPCPVLVVDDDQGIREVLTEFLEDEGYEVLLAEHGQTALDLLHRNGIPRLILLDLKMPVMTGAEFRQAQQQEPRLADIPVAVISAHARVAEAQQLHPVAFIPKPFDIDLLLDTVARLCG